MTRTTCLARFARVITCVSCFALSTAHAATITVDSLADDVFPDAAGAIFDINGMPIVLPSLKCTLRMAIASANLDMAVGGANGCVAGSGPDLIVFAASLNLTAATPGTITLADRGMSEAPATYVPPQIVQSALIASRPLTITGPWRSTGALDSALDEVLEYFPAPRA
jgi:hypothetical protein